MKTMKPRNYLARELRSPRFRKQIVRSRKTYTRKGAGPRTRIEPA